MREKRCFKCKKLLPIYHFCKDKRAKDNLNGRCKECSKIAFRKWQMNNLDKCRTYEAKYRKANPDEYRARQAKWWKDNPDKCRLYGKKQQKNSKHHLSSTISVGIWKSLHGNKGRHHWENLVGYTINALKNHLQKKFLPGMTWKNYGQWHIDHKIPVSAFNFETPNDIDFQRCWSLKNLRPLWANDNRKKHNKLDQSFQPSLKIGG